MLASKSLCVAARLLVEWSTVFADARSVWTNGGGGSVGGSLKKLQRFNIEDAAHACNLETLHQIKMWGEVEDTHDVDREDLRRQLGSVIALVHGD